MSQFFNPPEGSVQLTPKQANIYLWGWQKEARFRDAVCGRRFGKTFLAKAEMRRAARLAAKWNVSVENEIWYAAPTFKQAKRVFWKRLKQAIPASWRAGKPNETECSITLRSGHIIRVVGLDNYDDLRGSGLFFLIIDEWADCKWAAWEEVLRPMLSTCKYMVNGEQRVGGHVLRIGTPKGFNHCYDTFMDGQPGHQTVKAFLTLHYKVEIFLSLKSLLLNAKWILRHLVRNMKQALRAIKVSSTIVLTGC